ncbi:MAG: FABP family protein, partial [Sphingomonadales bacterium]|nr:FABP family protein [Sphingomonadales bacterium]
PKAEGPERKPYSERVPMQPIDPQANGPQLFYGLRYHLHINTPGEDTTFHDQTGYWLWEPATGLIMQTLAIPRGQIALASGHATPDSRRIVVEARRGETNYGICSTDFLEKSFRTDSYRLQIDIADDGTWRYHQTTTMMVLGQDKPFSHEDRNKLVKVGEVDVNPWLKIVRGQAPA